MTAAFNQQEFHRSLEQLFPAEFVRMTAKSYQVPNGYHSPRAWAYCALSAFSQLRDLQDRVHSVRDMDSVERTALDIAMSAMLASKHNFPVFFLSPALLRAAQLTDLPTGINWAEMKLPFEAGCLVLPVHRITFADGGACPFVFWTRVLPGTQLDAQDELIIVPHERRPVPLNYTNMYFWTAAYHPERFPLLALKRLAHVDLAQAVSATPDTYVLSEDTGYTPTFDEQLCQIAHIAANTLLMVEGRPGLKTTSQCLRPARKSKREIWSPIILGKDFQLSKPQILRNNESVTSDEHASPRMHWRRGHYRHQAYGEAYSLRRLQWIEPMLVNAKIDEATEVAQ